MSQSPSTQPYLDPYRRSQAVHGSTFEVTLWASPRTQRLRFEVFRDLAFFNGKTVLDAGCSRGDFAAYLLETEVPFGRFIGVDALCDVVAYANGRGLPRSEFHCGDFLSQPALLPQFQADIVTISGSLNTMTAAQASSVLESAWAAAGETLLFNFLSDRCGPAAPAQGDYTVRLDTMALLDWAMSRTPLVAFRQDYFPAGHDATIAMRREKR
ncbi:MAG: class I SAM-dependent methyltransferase [Planctomycetota bacterium]|nr:class I SAM-dependent methyltransferase [Planctomycetota bacterium]